jgi:imidazolonepropionase-like amidohydrolase
MKERGTAFTPTLLAAKLVDYRFKEASEAVLKAYRSGVPILYGSDLGIMSPKRSHEEFVLLLAAGLPADQVLRSATLNAATALGRADSLGSIAPGKVADLIAMKVNPLQHIDQLGTDEAVTFVMKGGQVVKSGK